MPNPLNPYDFVPFEANPPQRHCPPQTQALFDPNLFTGELECLLHTETPLFIHLRQERDANVPRPHESLALLTKLLQAEEVLVGELRPGRRRVVFSGCASMESS